MIKNVLYNIKNSFFVRIKKAYFAEMNLTKYITTTNRKFYKLTELKYFDNWQAELNSLYLDGKIVKRNGVNGVVVEVK